MQQPPATIEAARAALAAGQAGQAEAVCGQILARQSAHPEALYLLGLIRFRAGRAEEAARLLEQASAVAPGFEAAHTDLGAMLVTLGRPEEAVQRLEQAIRLNPGSAEAHLNLGNAWHAQGRLQAAEEHYRKALEINGRGVRAHVSLGNLLCQLRRPGEAHEYLSAAAALAPGVATVHGALGNALRDLGRREEAMGSYRRALELEPRNAGANENLGILLRTENRLEEALGFFNAAGKPYPHSMALACLLQMGRHDEFFRELENHRDDHLRNLHTASLSAYAADQLGRPDPHPFCPDPLKHVRIVDRFTGGGGDAQLLRDLIREAGTVNAVWEPRGVSTRLGYQTGGNLFTGRSGAIGRLKQYLLEELNHYKASLAEEPATLVTGWPGTMRLQGWFVRLVRGGHQGFHNHPFGWVSGCLYLQMPTGAPPGEGAIEFGLKGDDYPLLSDKPPPRLLHNPRAGQIALFPSSLYHRTIPFQSDEERLCIAFDLLPG